MDEEKKEHKEESVEAKEVKHEEKASEIKHEKKGNSTLTDKIRSNPWVVATVVLAVVVLILLFTSNFSSGDVTGASVAVASPDVVQGKVMDFVNSQVDEPAEVVSTTLKNGLYEVVVLYQGQQIPIYATADGENLVQGVTPIDQLMQAIDEQDSGSATQQATNVPKSEIPTVDLFVMSMCPYGTQAEKGILDVLELLGDKIDFNLRFVSYAMHGKDEVDQNTVQYCIQKEEPEKLYDYLRCYLAEGSPDAWDACVASEGINRDQLDSCISATDAEFKITELFNDQSTWSGGRYPQYNVDKDLNTEYGVSGSPTLVINGVKSNAGRDSASYLNAICAAFTEAPEECSTQLSSTAPAPGFGWGETAAADTAAQCG